MADAKRRTLYRGRADPAFHEKMRQRRANLDTRGTGLRRRPTRVWWYKGDVETVASSAPGQDWKRGRNIRVLKRRAACSLFNWPGALAWRARAAEMRALVDRAQGRISK